jgi:hypothetical protein
MNFEIALNDYVDNVQSIVNTFFKRNYANLEPPVLKVMPRGRVYKKVVFTGSQNSVHSFIDIKTGDIYKPASWKAPAKHARGSIYKDKGSKALDGMGNVRYLK